MASDMPLTITGAQTRRVQATAVTLAGSAPLADGGNGNVDVRFGGVTRMSVKNDGSVSITGNLAISGDLTDSTNGYLNAPISRTLTGTDVLTYLQAARDAAAKTPKLDIVRASPSMGVGSGVLMRDGRVYVVANYQTTARIFNPVTNTVTTPGGTFDLVDKFYGGTLLKDGRVFCVPSDVTYATIYDPVSDAISTPTPTFPASQSFRGGVTMLDGRVFLVPFNSATARIYDPDSDTLTTPNMSANGFQGGVLLRDGRVFCVPRNTTRATIYDPVSNTATTTPLHNAEASSFNGGVLLPDGRVFCVPYGATTARIYDPASGTFSTPAGTYPGGKKFYPQASLGGKNHH